MIAWANTPPSYPPAIPTLPVHQAETYACLAEVLARAGKADEARAARDRAVELCERKEAPTHAVYINGRLDALVGAPAPLP